MTIRELARIAGVSHTTVSRALRDHPQLSRQTCQEIQELARRHGYTPHPMVSQLMSQLPQIRNIARSTLAVVTRWRGWKKSRYVSAIHRGVCERAAHLGYKVEEFTLNSADLSPARLSRVLYSRGIEGVLFYPFESIQPTLDFEWDRFCGVAIGRAFNAPLIHRVGASYYENMMLAIRELRALGYKRLALALTPVVRARVDDAYLAAYSLYEREVPVADRIPLFQPEHLIHPDQGQIPGEHGIYNQDLRFDPRELIAWLRRHRADVVITNYMPTVDDLRAAGLRIPGEVGYVALDSICAGPEVSGIDQQPDRLGAAAVDLLTAHLHRYEHGIPAAPKVMSLQSRWNPGATVCRRIDGEDTAPPPRRRLRAA